MKELYRDFCWPDNVAERRAMIVSALDNPTRWKWILKYLGACKNGMRRVKGQSLATFWRTSTTSPDMQWWISQLQHREIADAVNPSVLFWECRRTADLVLESVYPKNRRLRRQKREAVICRLFASKISYIGELR